MPLPVQPSNIVATPGSEQVTVTFDESAGATSYDYQHHVRNTPWPATWQNAPNGPLVITGLANMSEYEVRVRARNDDGFSAWAQAAASATPLVTLAGLPAPAALNADPESGQVRASWDLPAGAVDGETTYDIAYGTLNSTPTPGSSDHSFLNSLTARTQIVDGLTNGTTYYLWVRTRSDTGPSAWVASGAVIPLLANGPAAPTFSATAESAQARLSIGSVAGATHYEYAFRAGDDTAPAEEPDANYVLRVAAEAGTVLVDELDNGTAYTFWARSVGPSGHGAWTSAAQTVTPMASLGAAAPQNLTTFASDAAVLLDWDAVADAIEYDYAYGTGTFADAIKVLFPNDVLHSHVVVTGLTNGTAYNFWVRAVTAKGAGLWTSVAVAATPNSDLAPLPPVDLTFLVRDTSIDVDGPDQPSTVTRISYRYRKTGTSAWTVSTADVTEFPFTISGLDESSTYEIQVRAGNATLWSSYSPTFTARTIPLPSSFSGVAAESAVELSWFVDTAVEQYDLRYRAEGEGDDDWIVVLDASVEQSTVTVRGGLGNGVPYEFQVRARIGASVTHWTASLILTPFLVQAFLPENVAVIAGAEEASMFWSAARGAAYYDFRFRPQNGSWTQINDHTSTEVVIQNLTAGTIYEFQVRARNVAGGITDWTESVEALIRNKILTDPAVADILVAPGTDQGIVVSLVNNLLRDLRLRVTIEPELPGREYTHVFQLPDDFVKAIEIKDAVREQLSAAEELLNRDVGAEQDFGYEIDGTLIYTNIEAPLIKYMGYSDDDDMRGSFLILAELLMTAALAHKYNRHVPTTSVATREFERMLAPALQTVIDFVDAKLIQFEKVTDVQEPR